MDKNALSLAITKALAYTENGGAPDIQNEKAGKSGEMKSMFQFLPATWKAYSKQVTGQENLPLTPENEALVVHGKVSQWLNQGYNTQQIASLWNSGSPNWEGKVGTNKEGVKYDTPAYVKKVQDYTDEFLNPAKQHLQGQEDEQNPAMQQLIAMKKQSEQKTQGSSISPGEQAATPQKLAPMQQLIQQQEGANQGAGGLLQKAIQPPLS